jgi:fatty-acyl-CoA synthase
MNLSNWIERQADFVPDRYAIRFAGQDLSYAELAQRVNRLSDVLASQLDVGHGDRVAYLGLNSPEIIILLFACARVGAMLVPLNWRLAEPEHTFMLRQSKPSVFFVEPGFIEHVENLDPDVGDMTRITYGKASVTICYRKDPRHTSTTRRRAPTTRCCFVTRRARRANPRAHY